MSHLAALQLLIITYQKRKPSELFISILDSCSPEQKDGVSFYMENGKSGGLRNVIWLLPWNIVRPIGASEELLWTV